MVWYSKNTFSFYIPSGIRRNVVWHLAIGPFKAPFDWSIQSTFWPMAICDIISCYFREKMLLFLFKVWGYFWRRSVSSSSPWQQYRLDNVIPAWVQLSKYLCAGNGLSGEECSKVSRPFDQHQLRHWQSVDLQDHWLWSGCLQAEV